MKLPVDYSTLDWRKGEVRAVREEYIKRQEGKCYWCANNLTGPPTKEVEDAEIDWGLFQVTFQNYPVHLQHDHYTNMTEGAVHMRCNAVMWQYHDR